MAGNGTHRLHRGPMSLCRLPADIPAHVLKMPLLSKHNGGSEQCVVSLFHSWRDIPGESAGLNLALRSVHVWRNWQWKQKTVCRREEQVVGTTHLRWCDWQAPTAEGHSGQQKWPICSATLRTFDPSAVLLLRVWGYWFEGQNRKGLVAFNDLFAYWKNLWTNLWMN